MTDTKNNLNFRAKVEFSKAAFLDEVPADFANYNPIDDAGELIFNTPRQLPLPTDDLRFTPLNLQAPEEPTDNLKTSDLIFCERASFPFNTDDCPTCANDPLAFVPDWRRLGEPYSFQNNKECKYSVVVDTGISGLPEDPSEIQQLKIKGIELLLEAYNRSKVTTTVYYVLAGQEVLDATENLSLQQLTPNSLAGVEQDGNKFAFQVEDFENVGSNIDSLLNGLFESVNVPAEKKGYTRLLIESETALVLLDTTTRQGLPAVTIEYDVPLINAGDKTRAITTKALVSVDVETFQRVPVAIVTQPNITENFEDNIIETTINGERITEDFDEVARSLRRANKYATNAIKGTTQGRFYYTEIDTGVPVFFDFDEQADKLISFRNDYLFPAIRKGIGITIADLDKVRITLERNPENTNLKIIEVVANRRGCEEVALSTLKGDGAEIDALFGYSSIGASTRKVTLGYVAAIPDMVYYIRGRRDIVWLEFITRFTYPQVEFRTPVDLVSFEDDRDLSTCAAEKTGINLVNKLLDDLLGTPGLLLDDTIESICRSAADVIDGRRTARELVNDEQRVASTAAIENLKLLISNTEESVKEARARAATSQELTFLEQELQKYRDSLQAEEERLQRANEGEFGGNAQKQIQKERWAKDLQSKLRNASATLESRPLAKILVEAIAFGLQKALSKSVENSDPGKERETTTQFAARLYELAEVQDVVDNVLGGWCGYVRLILEALQCVLNGIGADELKEVVVKEVLSQLKPHQLRNFLRELGFSDPRKLEKLSSAIVAVTGKSLENILDPLTDPSENQVFDYGAAYEAKYNELYPNLPEFADDPVPEAIVEKQAEIARSLVNDQRREFLKKARLASEADFDVGDIAIDGLDLVVDLLPEELQGAADKILFGRVDNLGDLLINLVIPLLIEIFSLNTLFDFLSENIPGFNIIFSIIKELECLVPKLPDLNPALSLNLKTLNVDLCALGVDGAIDFTAPLFNGGKLKITKTDMKNFWIFLGDYLHEMIVDIMTQLLVKALVTVVEATLDLACDLLKVAGASIYDAIRGDSKTREDLRNALCPENSLTDQEFNQALKNIFGALSNSTTGDDCIQNVTNEQMASFIDSVLVAVSYNEFYQILLGSANPETIQVIKRIAETSGSPCIADIFGNEDNVYDYFRGLGSVIDVRDTFNNFPEDISISDNLNFCPPENSDDQELLRYTLLKNQGLDEEQIQEQLDYLKKQAQNKLQDLLNLLQNGPYGDLPSLLESGDCPPSGLVVKDMALEQALDLTSQAIIEPVEQAVIRDLVGVRGIFPRVLSDTEGRGLRTHRFLTAGIFGNNKGLDNTFIQFYSDDSVSDAKSLIEFINPAQPRFYAGDEFGLGDNYPSVGSLIQPIGGFPATVGGYLFNKLLNYEIGLYTDANEGQQQEVVTFKTALRDLDLEQRNDELEVRNDGRIRRRIFYIARWAAVTHFVDYNTLEPFLDGSILGPSYTLEFTQKTKDILNSEPYQWTNPSIEKRRAIFGELVEACQSKIFFLPGNKTSQSEERVARLLSGEKSKKNLNINGRVVGIGLADYRDRINTNRFANIPAEGKSYWNINLARKFTLTQELRDLYIDIADTTIVEELEIPELSNPYELALEFVPYPLLNFEGVNNREDFKVKITYDMNPQNEDGTFFEDKYKYLFTYSNTYNPFGSDYVNPAENIAGSAQAASGENSGSFVPAGNGSILPSPAGAEDIVYMGQITSIPSEEVRQYVDSYIGSTTGADVTYSYETEFLKSWIDGNVLDGDQGEYIDETRDFFDFVNQGFFRRIARKIATDGTGLPTEGFRFGYDILKQPQAITLDPARYGGTEFNPHFYVEPPEYDGWLGLMQKFIPQEEGCNPRLNPLYDMRDIALESRTLNSQLRRDKRLDFSPICTTEAPYNFIRDNATVTSIESMIRMTTRVHLIDFILKSVPVFTQFSANFDGNFDELLESYLADYVLDRVKEEGVTRPRRQVIVDEATNALFLSKDRVAVNKYYLNFLESAVSNILLKIDSGIISEEDLSEDQRQAVSDIRTVISDYYDKFQGTEGVVSEEYIQTQDILKNAINPAIVQQTSVSKNLVKFNKFRAKRIKVSLLYKTVNETERIAKTIFSIYVKTEFNALKERLDNALKPAIDDLGLVLLSDPLFMNGHIRKRAIDRGTAFPDAQEDTDAPLLYATRPDGTIEYELPYDVPRYDISTTTYKSNIVSREQQRNENLEAAESLIEQIFQGNLSIDLSSPTTNNTNDFEWPFVLEKYIKIEDLPAQSYEQVLNRPSHLRGVVNLDQWVEYLSSLPEEIKTQKISDLWNSWSFGLRLSIVLDPEDPLGSKIKDFLKTSGLTASRTGDDGIGQLVTLEEGKQKIIIPIAAGELEVPDQIIGETTTFTDVLGEVKDLELIRQYDTLCLVNEMIKTSEFNTFFEYVFPLKRYLSILTVYISNAFYLSIGNSGPALPEIASSNTGGPGDGWAQPGGRPGTGFRKWDKNDNNFRKSKRIMRTVFMDLYNTLNKVVDGRTKSRKNKKFQPSSVKELLTDLIPEQFLDGMPWWQRKMRVDKPLDLFEGECQDEEDYF